MTWKRTFTQKHIKTDTIYHVLELYKFETVKVEAQCVKWYYSCVAHHNRN